MNGTGRPRFTWKMDVKMDEGRKMHFKYYVYPILSDLLMAKV